MPGFFEALQNFPEVKKQKPTVLIDGKKHEVSLDLFKQIMMHGEDQYEIKAGKIVRKPLPTSAKKSYEILVKADKGITFVDGEPYWPADIKQGGYEWRAQSE